MLRSLRNRQTSISNITHLNLKFMNENDKQQTRILCDDIRWGINVTTCPKLMFMGKTVQLFSYCFSSYPLQQKTIVNDKACVTTCPYLHTSIYISSNVPDCNKTPKIHFMTKNASKAWWMQSDAFVVPGVNEVDKWYLNMRGMKCNCGLSNSRICENI